MVVGATEDAVRQPTLVATKAQMDMLTLAGLNGVRVTQIWTPGQTAPTADVVPRGAATGRQPRPSGCPVPIPPRPTHPGRPAVTSLGGWYQDAVTKT